jgi:hypothetical protein
MTDLHWSSPFTRGNRYRKGGKKMRPFVTVNEAINARQAHWNANHQGKRDMNCPACADLDRHYAEFVHKGQ